MCVQHARFNTETAERVAQAVNQTSDAEEKKKHVTFLINRSSFHDFPTDSPIFMTSELSIIQKLLEGFIPDATVGQKVQVPLQFHLFCTSLILIGQKGVDYVSLTVARLSFP